MTTTARSSAADQSMAPVMAPVMTPRWALKRAAIGIAVLLAVVTGMALLMYASIEPEANERSVAEQRAV